MRGKTEGAARMADRPKRPLKLLLAAAAISAAALVAYRNSFSVPFLFDDGLTLRNNPSIRHLSSLGSVLFPPKEVFSAGRPFLNLTFALNYAWGGMSVEGYHALNLLIHILAGLTLFGIVEATLSRTGLRERYGGAAVLLALAVAGIWTLHPVQTESVTYLSQRAESLMGLCYLATLYFFIRAALSPAGRLWAALSIAACALGMMSKEVMVSAPVAVLLYDRAFLAGSFRAAWQRRRRTYLGLAATWLLLAALMASWGMQRRSVGYADRFTGWTYALTESKVVLTYLRLALWPRPLVFDYGPEVMISRVAEAAPYLLILSLLLALALVASKRWPRIGFLGVWLFLTLAPSSSVVPLAGQPMAEHRLYLPLAAISALAVVGLYTLVGRKGILVALPAIAIALGVLTLRRNFDYRSEEAIWTDTVSKCPGNQRARNNLGEILAKIPGRSTEAIAEYEAALRINPHYANALCNLGIALENTPGRLPDAIAEYEAALEIDPGNAEARFNLGTALGRVPGRLPDAIAEYEAALKVAPDSVEAENDLGAALAGIPGRMPDAVAHFEAAVKINPGYANAQRNLGYALTEMPGRRPEAIAHFEAALRIEPDDAPAHDSLGMAYAMMPGRLSDAISQYEAALKINPGYAEAHNNLANAFGRSGRISDAIVHYKAALQIDPYIAEAHFNLGNALLQTPGGNQEARAQFEAALRLRPDWEPLVSRALRERH
jgi:protein O-mannosyl-transferase